MNKPMMPGIDIPITKQQVCQNCGTVFTKKRPNHKYCGNECRIEKRKKDADKLIGQVIHVKDNLYKKINKHKGGYVNTYYLQVACSVCGELHLQHKSNSKRFKNNYCSEKCSAIGRTGENNANYKGKHRQKKYRENGYHILIRMPEHPAAQKGWVAEHRIVIEKKIGRILKEGELVHHKNMVKHDNNPDNLHVFENTRQHHLSHGSLNKLVEKLMLKNIIAFNDDTGLYELTGDKL